MVSCKPVLISLLLLWILNVSAMYEDCCVSYTRKQMKCHAMKGYSIQTSRDLCNIDAIIFYTKWGKQICADPSQQWVMDIINCLKHRVKLIAQQS
ncbi:C-C motif chemokine 20-like [Erpetoichthys calabaricus]|uniref:C-C motif chemokine 20-like n=1 Tax=Erpetoichthys calabaricus TaxID=27687 RepID=A0A8C4RWE0_ERPCA|nr:C-C motif chemokine 20-like [Erpetoichthys calabaricus]